MGSRREFLRLAISHPVQEHEKVTRRSIPARGLSFSGWRFLSSGRIKFGNSML
jgi:hypothetical protein